MSIQGVNGTIIGPSDLAINIAKKEENKKLIEMPKDEMYRHEFMINAYREIGKIAQLAGKFAGIHFSGSAQMDIAEMLVSDMGYRLIILGTDRNFRDEEILTTKKNIEEINSRF